MCTIDMLIQLSCRYALLPTEFTSFPSIPLCMLFMCLSNSAEDVNTFPQNSQIFNQHHNDYIWNVHSSQRKMCTVYHKIRKFQSTSQCVLLICSFNSAADMHTFPQSSQVFTLPHNQCIVFMCSFNSAEDMYVFPQKLQIFTLHHNVYFWYAY